MRQGSKRATRNSNRSGLLTGGLLTLMCVPALAGPEGERVVRGSAEFQRAGDVTTIVAADRTIINYRSFDIGAGETVRFVQPDADSRVLNRIKSATPTQIDGSLLANGRVYLVNAAGVTFGQGAVVDVGQLYAAAGNISNRDFLAGRDNFTLTGEVVNNGTIRAEQGVSLFGRSVINYGSISAPSGLVTLATGDGVYVGERGGHVFLKIDGGKAPGAGGVENSGTLSAQDLIVGAGDMYSVVLHDPSVLTAQRIRVEGGAGTTTIVKGTLDATNDAGQGGEIQVLGDKVALYGATLNASGSTGGGEILVGGDFQGQGAVRTSDRTYVDAGTTLEANATGQGDGGKVIVWADEVTGFLGQVNARGAGEGGHGGFAEVSGKQNLLFVGDADLSAGEGGQAGTILFDPDNVTITDGAGGADDANADFSDGSILSGEGPANAFISEQFLEGFGGAVIIQANDNITINNLTDNVLDFAAAAGTVQFVADFDADGSGNFSMDVTDTIRTQGANLDISGDVLTVHGVTTNGGNVNLTAVDGITLGNGAGSVTIATGGGSFTAEANSDFDATGVFNVTSSATINSGGGNITIAGGQWTIGATGTINAGAGDVTFNASRSVSASVGNTSGTINLSAAELARITTSGTFSVGTGGITPTSLSIQNFDNATGITGDAVFQAAGDVSFVSSQSDFDGDLTVIADGSVNLTSTADVTVAGNVSITADNDGDNNTNGDADILNIGGNRSITASGTVDVAAADITIGAGGALSGSTVTIDRSSAGSIGFGVDAGEDMVLDEDEIDRIVADDLVIGGDLVTDIIINTVDGVNGLQFATINNEVTFNAGGTGGNIVVSGEMTTPAAVNFLAADGVTISADVTSAGAVFVNANSDALVDGGTFQVDDDFTLDSDNNDIIIIASDVALGTGGAASRVDAGTQDIIISQWTSTESIGLGGGAGTMSLSAAELNKLSAATLTIGGDGTNPDVAEVDAITLDGATFTGITGLVTLNTTTSTGTITFTGADSTTPAGLTAQAGGGITFDAGATINGTATLDADFLDSGTGIFTINSGETLTVSGAALTITAADADLSGAIANAGQTTTITGSQVTDAIDLGTAGSGTMSLTSAELATITAQNLVIGGTGSSTRVSEINVDGLLNTAFANITTGVTINAQQSGGVITFSGGASAFSSGKTVQINAENGVTVSANVTTAGTTTLRADFDSDGTGTLTVDDGVSFSSGSSALSILAGDVSLAGSSGSRLTSSVLSIGASTTGATIGLGDAAGGLSLSNTELARITAGTSLTVGASTNTGGITVDGVSSANLSAIGTLILETASSITFNGADSSFGALTANADAGITVSGVALSTSGTTTLDADDNADGAGTFTVSGGGSYATTGGTATIQAADVDISGASDVTIGGTSLTITTSQTTRDISVGANNGGLHLSNAELGLISGNSLIIGASSGATTDSVTVDDIDIADLAGVTAVTFNANAAGGVVEFANNDSVIDAAVTAQARDGILVDANLTTGGATTFDADFNNDAVGDFTLNGNLIAGGNVVVIGDDAAITGTIDATGFDALFARSTADAMFVGTAGAGFSLSTAELANVTAGSLTIGGTSSGREVDSITVDGLGAGALANITGTVTLNATGDGGATEGTVVFTGSDSTLAADLEINADEGIDQDVTVTIGGAGVFNADADSDNSGAYDLAAGESLIVSDTLDLTAASVAFGAGAALTNTGGTVTIQHSAAGTIGLGSGAGDLTLDNTVLGAIDTANLTIGGADTATITVDNASFAGVTGTLTLDASAAGGAISFDNASVSVSAGLVATATDSITINSGADITVAATSDGDASFTAATITISDDIVFTNNGSLSIDATDVFLGGDVVLSTAGQVGDDIEVTGDVESSGGSVRDLTVNAGLADVTFNGTLGFSGGSSLINALDVTGATITMAQSTFTDLSQTYNASTLLRLGNSSGASLFVVASTGDFDASASDTQLLGDVTISNQGTLDGDDILFGAINGDGNGPWDLQLAADGLGDVVVTGDIGATNALDGIVIESADDVTFGGTVDAASFLQDAGAGTTTFSDAVTLAGTLSITGTDVTLDGTLTTGGNAIFSLTGTLDINQAVDATGAFSQGGGGSVTIADGGDIDADSIAFDDDVTLDAASTVDMTAATGITFGDTLDADSGTLNLTTDGALGFGGAVTGTGTLNITSATGVTGDIGIGDDAAGDLTIDTDSIANVQSGFAAVNVGTATTGEHDFEFRDNDEDIVLNSGMTFHSPVAGTISVETDIDGSAVTTGAFTFEGSGSTTVLNADIISGGADIVINDSVVVDENADVTLDSGGGNISITGTVEGTTGGGDESLTFDAGGGTDGTITIGDTLSGSAGAADATGLAAVSITAGAATSFQAIFISGDFLTTGTLSGDFSAAGAVEAANLTIDAGADDVSFASTVDVSGDVDLTGDNVTLSDTVTSTGGGLTVANTAALTIDGTVTLAGDLVQSGGGTVALNADINSGNGDITFADDITTTGDRVVDSGSGQQSYAGSISAAGNMNFRATGDGVSDGVTFGDTVDGTGTITFENGDATGDYEVGDNTTGASVLIDGTSLGQVSANWGLIAIGTGAENGEIEIGDVSLAAPVTVDAGTAAIDITGALDLTTSGDDLNLNTGTGVVISAGGSIATTAGDITIQTGLTIGENADASIDSGDGNIDIQGAIGGTAGGGDETLIVDAGAGNLTIAGSLTGDGTGADATGLVDFTINNAATVDMQGVDIDGTINTNNRLTGDMTTNGQNINAGIVDLSGIGFTLAGIDSSDNVFIDNNGLLVIDGDVTAIGAFFQLSGAGTGSVELGGDIDTNNAGSIGFQSGVTLFNGDRVMEAGANSIIFADTLDTDGFSLTLIADGIDFDGGVGSVSGGDGTNRLILAPSAATVDIDVGDVVGDGGALQGGLDLNADDIAALAEGFLEIEIGYAGTGSHSIQIGTATFADAVEFHAPVDGATDGVSVIGTLTSSDDTADRQISIEILGSGTTTTLSADIITAGGDIFIDDNVVIAEAASITLDSNNGNIEITGSLQGTTAGADEDISIAADAGTITIGDTISGSGGGSDATGLSEVFLLSADGGVSIQGVSIFGLFDVGFLNRIGNSFTTNGQTMNIGSGNFVVTAADFGVIDVATGDFTIDNSALLDLNGDFTSSGGSFIQTDTAATGTVEIGGDMSTFASGGDITFESGVTITDSDRDIDAGTGGIVFGNTLAAQAFNLTLSGNQVDFDGGTDTVTGTGILTIRPADENTDLDVGDIAGAGGTPGTGLQFSLGSLDAIADGFDSVEFGWETIGNHAVQVAGVSGANAFGNDTVFHTAAGGQVTFLNDFALTDTNLSINGNTVAGNTLEIDTGTGGHSYNGDIDAQTFDLTLTGNRVDFNGGNDSVSGSGVLTIRPADENTDLDVGNISGAGGTPGSGLRFGLGDLAAIAMGFDSVEFGWETIGNHNLQVAGISGGNAFDNDLVFHSAAGGQVTFLNGLTLVDTNLTVNGNSVAGNTLEIDTGTGGHSYNGDIDAQNFNLTLTGNRVDFNGGADSVTGTGVLTIRPADENTDLDVGNISGAGGTPGAGLRFGLGDLAAIANGFTSVEFGWATIGNHAIQVAGVSGGNAFGNHTVFHTASGGQVDFLNDFSLTNANLTVNGDANALAALEIFTGTGGQSWNGALDASTFDLTLSGNRIDFNGGADSVTGTGLLTIRPSDDSTDIDVGNIVGAGGTPGAGLRFGLGDLIAIADGFTRIDFGYSGTGAHTIQIAGINNQTGNHIAFNAPGGTINFLNHYFNDGFNLTVNGDAAFGSDLEIRSGTGLQGWNGAVSLGAFNGTFSANLVSFDGGADSVTGTGIINIRPGDEFTDMDIGNVLAAGGTQGSGLRFGVGDLAALADGFSQVWFGYAILGQNTIQIGDVTGTSALNDDTFFWAPAGGSITVLRNLATDLDGALHFVSPTSAIVLDDGANITVGDGSLTFAGDVSVTGTASAIADGTVTFDGDVEGVAGGSAESLTVGSGMFDIIFNGLVAGAGGASHLTGLTDLTFASGHNVTFNSGLSIDGLLSSTSRLTGLFTTGINDIEVGGTDLVGTDFIFDGINALGDLDFDNDGTLCFNDDVFTDGSIRQVSGGGTGAVEIGDNLTATAGSITFQSMVTLKAGPVDLTSVFGVISFGDPFVASPDGMLDLAGFDLTLIAQDVNFFGGPGSVKDTVGGGGLVLQPGDPSQAIDVGDVSVAQAGAFSLNNDDLAALSGVGALTIGRADGMHTNFVVENALFQNDVTLRSPSGGIFELLGTIASTGFDIIVDGVDVQFAGEIGTAGGDVSITGPITLNNSSTIQTLGGRVDIFDTVDGGFGLFVTAFDGVNRGNVNFRDVIGGGSALTSLEVEGWDVLFTGIGGGSAGVSTSVLVNAHDDLIFSGGTYNAFAQTYNAGDENRMNVVDTTFTSNGDDITFGITAGPVGDTDGFQGVFLLGRHALTVNTGGGNLFLDGGLDASFGGTGTPDVVFDAGTGAISVAGAIGAGNAIGSVDFTGSSISVNSVFTNRFQLFAATTTFINGDHSTALSGSGPIEFTGDVVLAGDSNLSTINDGIVIAGRVDGPFAFGADAGFGGDLTIGGAIGSSVALTALNLLGNNVTLNGIGTETDAGVTGDTVVTAFGGLSLFTNFYNTNGAAYSAFTSGILLDTDTSFLASDDNMTFVGAIHGNTGAENLDIDIGNGELSLAQIGTQADGTDPASTPTIGDIAITAGEVDLTANVFGLTLTLRPSDTGAAIVIGGADNGTAGDGIFTLTTTELGFFAPIQPTIGFARITIGRLGATHDVTINGAEFFDPTSILANGAGGSINILGEVIGSDDASLEFNGLTNLGANVTTAGNAVTFTGGVNVTADSTVDTDGGDIQLTGALNGPASLTLNAFNGVDAGNITINGIIGVGTALANLTLDGFDNALFRVGSDVARGVLGTLTLVAADDNIFNGVGYFAGTMIFAAADENRITIDDTAFQTIGGDISFNDGRLLLRDGDSASFNTAGGDIVFADGIQGDSAAPGAGDVLINTGAGSTTMLAGVGTVDKIATLDITSALISLLDVVTSGSQTYNGTTTLGGDLMSMTAGDITVNGDVTIEDDISVSTAGNAGDDIAFNGAIIGNTGDGLEVDGAAVSFGGDVLLVDEDLVVTGDDITFGAFNFSAVGFDINGGTVTFEGGSLTSEASLIDISGTTIDFNAELNANSGASVLFTNSGNLTFGGLSRLNLTGDLVQLGAGTVTFNITSFTTFNDISVASVVTPGDISFSGPVRLGTNMHFEGNNVAFLGTIDSADASDRSLSISGMGTITFGDAIGGTFDLAQLFVQTDGGITVADNVTTSGEQTYNGPLTILGASTMTSGGRTTFSSNVTLDDDLTVRSFDTITFGADILGTDTPGDLTLEITQDIPVFLAETAEAQARAMPVIAIAGSMGTADDPLGNINLNVVDGTRVTDPSNVSAYPASATILIGVPGEPVGTPLSTIDIFADSFCVGFFEKVSFFGNLNMVLNPAGVTEGVLKIGDAVVMGTARIQADRIEFQRRPRANYLSAFITGDDMADFTYGLQDAGADFIVLGVNDDGMGADAEPLTENVLTIVGNAGDPVIETTDATVDDSEVQGNFFIGLPAGRSSVADASQDALLSVVITQPLEQYGREEMFVEDLAVDIDGRGVAGNSAVARAGAIAAADDLAELPQDTSVGASAQEVLNQMGIQLIDVGPDALLDSLVGWALYNDLASSLGPDENKITRNRVDLTLVDRVISTYNRLFNVTGPDGTIVGSRQAEIKQGFTDAFIAWLTATNAEAFDAAAFDAWIRTSPPEAAQAANDLELLRELLNLIDLLGLSPREFAYARSTILSYIKPDDLSTDDFRALVEGAAAPAPAGQ